MSSFVRNLQRKVARAGTFTTDEDGNTVHVRHEPHPQRMVLLPDGGYVTVRYTKGPLRVSAVRLRAQGRVAEVSYPAEAREQERRLSQIMGGAKPRWPSPSGEPIPEGRVTRQRLRFAKRKGLEMPVEGEPKAKPARKSRAKKVSVEAAA